MSAVALHGEVLTEEAAACARRHGSAIDALGFHLAGGTAVALHLGHRRSIDFDWFREAPLDDPLDLARSLQQAGCALTIESTARGTLHARIDGVRSTFLEYRYPRLEPLVRWPQAGAGIASRADLSAMKLAAVVQRGARRDFYDVHALGLSGRTLEQMLDDYRNKYSIRDIAHVLTALTWFEDAERDPQPDMLASTTWAEVCRALQDWVRRASRGA